MRGNRAGKRQPRAEYGSIPAYAGEPVPPQLRQRLQKVYPRVCGGTRPLRKGNPMDEGLSPRMRGNHYPTRRPHRAGRSIPAYAGEPWGLASRRRRRRVYPRVCGGTGYTIAVGGKSQGLSPRMRGNLCHCYPSADPARSIPAYAGEPRYIRICRDCGQVYPRVCGGTGKGRPKGLLCPGLSPRMRGNLVR